jgi:hypothetical protein
MKDISINDVKDPLDKVSETNIDSFFNFKEAKVKMLTMGDRLWRFSTDHEKYFSDCWVDTQTLEEIFRRFANEKAQNEFGIKRTDRMVKTIIRESLSILGNWKSYQNFLLQVEFKVDVVAYYGIVGSQQHFKALNNEIGVERSVERYLGGLNQYVIPRFKNNISQNRASLNEEIANVTYLSSLKNSSWYKKYTW